MSHIGVRFTYRRRLLALLYLSLGFTSPAEAKEKDTSAWCPILGDPVVAIEAATFYQADDPSHSRIDPDKLRENVRLTRPVSQFLDTLATLSDSYVLSPSPDVKQCTDHLLYQWARAGALTDISQGVQARFVQEWSLASLGFLRMKLGPLRDHEQDEIVRAWMHDLAASVANLYPSDGGASRNNLYYWAMLAIAVTGHSTDDVVLWKRAEDMNRVALSDIQANGTLPAELKRASRAAWYHAFAAEPLVLFKLVSERCRNQPYQGDRQLDRLLDIVYGALNGSPTLHTITGVEQVDIRDRYWINLWNAFEGNQPYIVTLAKERNLGGSVDMLYRLFRDGCRRD